MAVGPPPPAAASPAPAGTAPPLCAARSRQYLLAAAILASALGFIDGSIVSIAMPAMRETLGASLPQAQWIANAYFLTLSALILAGGALADRLGLVRVFATGIAVFVAASLACAAAPSPETLIAARAAKGAGAALMIPGSLALIARAYPPAERGAAIGLWAAASAVTTALGPLLGGAALSLGGAEMWRALFAINLPLGTLALWLLLAHAERETERTGRAIDWPGAALATASLGLIAWALTGPNGAGGLLAGALGIAAFAAFLAVEHRRAEPMMPLGLFADPTFAAANAITLLIYFALATVTFFLPMAAISAWEVPEWAAGAALLPLTAAVGGLSRPMGALAARIGPRRPITLGAGLVALAYAGLALTAPAGAFWAATFPFLCVMGLGMGIVVAPLSTAVMGAVPDTDSGTASGVNNAISRVASLLAVAAMGWLAAERYTAADGPESFAAGGVAATEAHRAATEAALAAQCGTVAVLALIAAALAWTYLSDVPRG